MSHLKDILKYNIKQQLKWQHSSKILKNLKEIHVMAALPRDIEITENGTPEHNRVTKLRMFSTTYTMYITQKKIKKMVKQVVTMVLTLRLGHKYHLKLVF